MLSFEYDSVSHPAYTGVNDYTRFSLFNGELSQMDLLMWVWVLELDLNFFLKLKLDFTDCNKICHEILYLQEL